MFDLVVHWLKRLTFIALIGAAIVVAAALVAGARADEPPVDVALVTALDVSSSINAQETMLQVEGMAQAIKSPAVVSAIVNGAIGRVGFAVFVWADGAYPSLLEWRAIGSQAEAEAAAAEILATLQAVLATQAKQVGTLTNLSGAMEEADRLFRAAPFPADRYILNVVGNGADNVGEDPSHARAALLAAGATINGVVVGGDPAVMAYYRAQVIGGRYAFCLPADSADQMAAAFIAKFVTEIALR
jgi:hypothetical protein